MKAGVNIHGLFLQGGKWSFDSGKIEECAKGELFCLMPSIWIEPVKSEDLDSKGTYQCPLYKTSERKGELSTTGNSTNFVLYLDLPTTSSETHWIKRGTALLCQLDD